MFPPGGCWRWDEFSSYLPQPARPHIKLFELGSPSDLLWGFGDGDALHVYAPADDAARGVFDEVGYDES